MQINNESKFDCLSEELIKYIDARLVGDLDTAYKIKRRLSKKNPAESMICHICKKVSNKGTVIVENGILEWECSRCKNMQIVRKSTLFNNGRKEGN